MKRILLFWIVFLSTITVQAAEREEFPWFSISDFTEVDIPGKSRCTGGTISNGESLSLEDCSGSSRLLVEIYLDETKLPPQSCSDPYAVRISINLSSLGVDNISGNLAGTINDNDLFNLNLDPTINTEYQFEGLVLPSGNLLSGIDGLVLSVNVDFGSTTPRYFNIDEISFSLVCNSNPYNETLEIVDNQIQLTDGCGTLTADLPDADCCDDTDEVITDFRLEGNLLIIEEGGKTFSVDLSTLLATIIPTMTNWFMFLMGILLASIAIAVLLQMKTKGLLGQEAYERHR